MICTDASFLTCSTTLEGQAHSHRGAVAAVAPTTLPLLSHQPPPSKAATTALLPNHPMACLLLVHLLGAPGGLGAWLSQPPWPVAMASLSSPLLPRMFGLLSRQPGAPWVAEVSIVRKHLSQGLLCTCHAVSHSYPVAVLSRPSCYRWQSDHCF